MPDSEEREVSTSEEKPKGPCSLSGDELEHRLALIRAEISPYVTRTDAIPTGVAWEFHADSEIQGKLERLVELERRCCGGLDWRLASVPGPALRLSVEG